MVKQLATLIERLDALSLKERVLVLGALLLVLGMVWDRMLFEPLWRHQLAARTSVGQIKQELTAMEAEGEAVLVAAKRDPDAPVRAEIEHTRAAIAELEKTIKDKAGKLVPPDQMPKVLESVLTKFEGLEFVGLEGLGAEPLVTEAAQDGHAPAADLQKGAFRHGLRLRFAGSYLDTLEYLRALEKLPWGFFWESVDLRIGDYPRAEGSVVVYTLSLDRGWIGI
jgi:MSHA biogenesis protein MshJ